MYKVVECWYLIFYLILLGRHPCAGMKIAKLEIKLILAMMLLGYEYELVDSNGNHQKVLPDQNRNDVLQVSTPVHFKSLDLVIIN